MVETLYEERDRLKRQLETLKRALDRIAVGDSWDARETALYALISAGLRQSDAETRSPRS